jgi:TetR/AcrR family fatty acid metabolism transcriptional regulator
MTPKKVDRTARREEILTAALRVFARNGYAASRIEEVAKEAGIAKGSVYLYFDSREELLTAAFEGLGAQSAHLLDKALTGPGDAVERLAGLVRGIMHYLSRERDLSRVVLDLWSAGSGSDSPIDMAAMYAEYRTVIARLLEQAWDEGATLPPVDPSAHAAVIIGALDGCLLQSLLDPGVNPAELAEPVVRLLVPEGVNRS